MPDPRAAAGTHRWLSPQDEYVHSLENGGAGVPLTVVAKRWGRNYDDLKVKARGVPLQAGGHREGSSWRELRAAYLERMWRAVEEKTIAAYAERHARVESDYAEAAQAQLVRVRRELKRRLGDSDGRGGSPLDVKSDKDLVDLLDKLNKVHRRNVGLPERSVEIRGRAEFVRETIERVVHVIRRHVRDPDLLRLIAFDFQAIEQGAEQEENAAAALGPFIDVPG